MCVCSIIFYSHILYVIDPALGPNSIRLKFYEWSFSQVSRVKKPRKFIMSLTLKFTIITINSSSSKPYLNFIGESEQYTNIKTINSSHSESPVGYANGPEI